MKGESVSAQSRCRKNDSSEILWLVYDLRKRLGWPYKGIELGEKPVAKKTIDTTVDELADDGQFRYCLERGHDQPTARYNPYDLVVVAASAIKTCRKYYTVSATYVTMVSISFCRIFLVQILGNNCSNSISCRCNSFAIHINSIFSFGENLIVESLVLSKIGTTSNILENPEE